MRRQPESQIQQSIVNYLKISLPRSVVMAIPNASRRTASGRASNAVAGLLPGAPDLVIALPDGRTLWMEVKAEGGKASANQILVHGLLTGLGHTCVVVRSIDDARRALAFLGIKTRELFNGATDGL